MGFLLIHLAFPCVRVRPELAGGGFPWAAPPVMARMVQAPAPHEVEANVACSRPGHRCSRWQTFVSLVGRGGRFVRMLLLALSPGSRANPQAGFASSSVLGIARRRQASHGQRRSGSGGGIFLSLMILRDSPGA
jgi:hypothetical protein